MERTQAYRRHQSEKARRRARRITERAMLEDTPRERKWAREFADHFHDTMTRCSCWMCGNPRRHIRERTPQEIREDERMRDQLRDVT